MSHDQDIEDISVENYPMEAQEAYALVEPHVPQGLTLTSQFFEAYFTMVFPLNNLEGEHSGKALLLVKSLKRVTLMDMPLASLS